jgi:hypothetical protein
MYTGSNHDNSTNKAGEQRIFKQRIPHKMTIHEQNRNSSK